MVGQEKLSGSSNLSWLKEDVSNRIAAGEDAKSLWAAILERFESGGEPIAKAFVRERFSNLESQILSKIEQIKQKRPAL